MRILHFLPVYAPAWQFGGPVLSVSRLCEALVKQGVDIRVITTNTGLPELPPDQLGVPQNINGVQVTYYPADQNTGPISSKALVQSLSEHMQWAELVHLSSIWQPLGLPVQTAAHIYGVPVIQTLRGALGPYSWRRGWWKKVPYFFLKERPMLQRAAAIHCTTEQEARELAWLRLKPPQKLLPNPLDLSQLRCHPHVGAQWRQKMGIRPDIPLLLVVGRLHHKKGLDRLPVILRSNSNQPWHIVFIGGDDDGTGHLLRRKLKKYNLLERSTWIESLPVDELLAPYNASDCLILPSRHENFGNVVVEALSCGSAVLISDKVGVADVIKDCPQVFICELKSNQWAQILRHIMKSPRPGMKSSTWVSKRFSSDVIALQALTIYTEVLKNNA